MPDPAGKKCGKMGHTEEMRMNWLATRLKLYWKLIKSLQTGLLLATGLAGYMSAHCPVFNLPALLALAGSLCLAISGSTVLNMVWDADIDALMRRTARRPLPAGQVSRAEAGLLGALLSLAGVSWALALDPVYAAVVAAGVFFDVVVYTMLLKRRTPYSILIGGLAGGMPALAGRTLATGAIDPPGLLLALGVLLWIPTHILTFSLKHRSDYAAGGIPTFAGVYGGGVTRIIVGCSTVLAAGVFLLVGWWSSLPQMLLGVMGALGVLLAALVGGSLVKARGQPGSHGLDFVLYKGASLYMAAVMLLIIIAGMS
jgi:heme o synthase